MEAQTELLGACEEWLDSLPEGKASLVRPDYQPGLRRILLDTGIMRSVSREIALFIIPRIWKVVQVSM